MEKVITISLLAVSILASAAVSKAATWIVPEDFATIQEAIDSPLVVDGDKIRVCSGNHAGALINKSVEIKGKGGAVINDGPAHSSGLIQGFRLNAGSDGTTISHLDFAVDLGIMNGDAVNDVSIHHCKFINPIQGVSNWRGSGWEISHNIINDLRTRNGGGIGIMIADYSGGIVKDNFVSHNTITGTLHVDENDGGGYAGSGIVIYADFRWGRLGAVEMSENKVTKNKVAMSSDTPEVVDIVAFELTDTRDDPELDMVIFDNAIGFNDFRGTEIQIALTPEELADYNTISRNLGDNRGKNHGEGAHPSIFKP